MAVTIFFFLRHESASILLNASTLWITGGKNLEGTYLVHTELVSSNQSAIGPELPVPMAGHCVVVLGIYIFFQKVEHVQPKLYSVLKPSLTKIKTNKTERSICFQGTPKIALLVLPIKSVMCD